MFTQRKIYKVVFFIDNMKMNKTEQINEDENTEMKKGNEDSVEMELIEKKLDEANFLAEERLNHLKYLQADFDNYRKKFEKEKENIIKLSNEDLILELIVILDDFDNSLKIVENGKDKEGILLIYKKLFKILHENGLRHIESIGKKFDPNFHEAIFKEESEREEGTILEEFQKGYILNSKVIRYSKVKISENKKEKDEKKHNHKDLKTEKEDN